MKWMTALIIGLVFGFVLPTAMDLRSGVWTNNWTGWGTIHPMASSPGLLFSIPVFLGVAFIFRLFFNWHSS
jgi:hypothetical protein